MDKIDIEKIMEEIREEIRIKGYSNDMLSFNDIIIEPHIDENTEFDKVKFNEELYELNNHWNISSNHSFSGNKVVFLFKRIVRKCIRFHINPIVDEQNYFNAAIVRSTNLIDQFISHYYKEQENERNKYNEVNFVIKREIKKELLALRNDNEMLVEKINDMEKKLEDLTKKYELMKEIKG